jgi:hypothetical protein
VIFDIAASAFNTGTSSAKLSTDPSAPETIDTPPAEWKAEAFFKPDKTIADDTDAHTPALCVGSNEGSSVGSFEGESVGIEGSGVGGIVG